MEYGFQDYIVIVTGGTRGIGRACTEAFLKSGARVVATYAGNDKVAEEFRNSCCDAGDRLELAKFDVSSYSEVEAFFADFDSRHKRLDVVVNNAGIRKDSVVGMMPLVDWERVLAVNLTGTFNMSKFAVMRMMQNRFGRIVTMTSPSGQMGFEGQANYASAKAGQVAFTKTLSKEVAKRGITVNCVSPGFIDTELIADLPEELRARYKSQVPMKRFGKVDEIAEAVLFLSSGVASYITGTVMEVTGGL